MDETDDIDDPAEGMLSRLAYNRAGDLLNGRTFDGDSGRAGGKEGREVVGEVLRAMTARGELDRGDARAVGLARLGATDAAEGRRPRW